MKKTIFKAIFYFIGLFLIALYLWTNKYFDRVTVDQVLFTFKFGIKGAFDADADLIHGFFKWCLIWPTIVTIVLVVIEKTLIFFAKKEWIPGRQHYLLRFICLGFQRGLAPLFLILGIIGFSYEYSVGDFIVSSFSPHPKEDYFKTHFKDPNELAFKVKKPKNLVLIYIESLETTYSDKNIFGHDLLKKLNDAKKRTHAISFPNYVQMPGTGWTIAGIVATQCGLPLKALTMFGNNNQGKVVADFLPGAKCLGDILAEHGYQNVFINGPHLDFAGKGKFFQQHHYQEVLGYDELLANGFKPKTISRWGLYDDDLFTIAKEKLSRLMKSKKPFNLTILTVDTHGPEGYLSDTCKKQGFDQFEGIVECTSNFVADYIQFIEQHGWLDQITVVVLGDHLVMRNSAMSKYVYHYKKENRSVFNMIITKNKVRPNTNTITHFDMLPIMLESLGFTYAGNQLGLGYSVFSPIPGPVNRIKEYEINLRLASQAYNKLWIENL